MTQVQLQPVRKYERQGESEGDAFISISQESEIGYFSAALRSFMENVGYVKWFVGEDTVGIRETSPNDPDGYSVSNGNNHTVRVPKMVIQTLEIEGRERFYLRGKNEDDIVLLSR